MTRGTPEGARDFLTPVRLQPGKFFALAQSPQLFKQLCMVGGIDRYYQIATCWRDEDLRADRQFEFRQLDLELAFAEQQEVLEVMEAAVASAFEALGRPAPPRPFPQLTYDDAMARFGSDKPDLRFGMEIQDATEVTRGSEFGVFASAPTRPLHRRAEDVLARPSSSRLEELAKEWGAQGSRLPRPRRERRGALADREVPLRASSSPRSRRSPARRCSSAPAPETTVARVLGLLRLHLARELELVDARDRRLPLGRRLPALRAGRGDRRLDVHAPPVHGAGAGRRRTWDESNPVGVHGQHYDLVWNGVELGSGSIRVHDVELQQKVFRTMGLSAEEAQAKFGYLLEALAMGAPPHGGFAMGIERFVALLAGEPDIRQIVAFPKVSSGSDPLTGAPTPMPAEVLAELGIAALPQE